MLGAFGGFLVALWHVVGLLILLVFIAEFGVDGWRRLSRRSRYHRPTRPDRAATADAYAGVDWSAGYFNEFRRAIRVEWAPYVEWWQRPFGGAFMTLDRRGLPRTPGEDTASEQPRRREPEGDTNNIYPLW